MNIIAAMTKDRVIGKDNKLIWNIPVDLKNFRNITSGNTVIMGRKTFESIGNPLPNRHNIVVSSSMQHVDGIDVCKDIKEALAKAKEYGKEIFIIGGSSIYRQTVPFADKMYISWVKKYYHGDAYFPDFDIVEWEVIEEKNFPEFDFVVYKRRK
ncbi:dihydrofolate reductase [Candidatus Woesearchaeota archaeon]|nr:dihydrofolate reductase [Candidatus Woesearchaeota archaeon]